MSQRTNNNLESNHSHGRLNLMVEVRHPRGKTSGGHKKTNSFDKSRITTMGNGTSTHFGMLWPDALALMITKLAKPYLNTISPV